MKRLGHEVVVVETDAAISETEPLRGGRISQYIMPWLLICIPLFLIGYGGMLVITGLRHYDSPCDESIASMLIALGSLLIAPFIMICLFAPAFVSSGGTDTDELFARGAILIGILDFVSFALVLTIASAMIGGAQKCDAQLLSEARPLFTVGWVVFVLMLAFAGAVFWTRKSSTSSVFKV